jgi:single-strand DNA-binding protein
MASINKVVLIGHLGHSPERRSFPNGDAICSIRLATTDKWKDKNSGEMREATEWHSVVFTGRLAEVAAQYLSKGSLIYVGGSLRTRKYKGKDGTEKYATEIRADEMQMLTPKPQSAHPVVTTVSRPTPEQTGFDDMEDDIPF